MKITHPKDGDTIYLEEGAWNIRWEDVAPGEPQCVNFWLTHYTDESDPSPGNYDPHQIFSNINIHEQSETEPAGSIYAEIKAGCKWRIWAMECSKTPGKDMDPIAESESFCVRRKRSSDLGESTPTQQSSQDGT
ncbi:hypothetical protein ASPCADRAFT_648 [Aspergillus carbonarius ITEM 5010]|uniref:Uncharacterized protein n=1 Tax=Aspergillus carbonarius (strain ITEM 5010) TaxID=602072 RepID=A0A1R3S297_ASPC5|nr:hypothetical protein ASPCADRAFT_648 [Aspergillus carbonarius ITEM 5010]